MQVLLLLWSSITMFKKWWNLPVDKSMGKAGLLSKWDIWALSSLWQASPRLRFNKEGSLLAVTASDNGIKILANRDGLQLLRAFETTRSFDTNRVAPEPAVSKVGSWLATICSSMLLLMCCRHIQHASVHSEPGSNSFFELYLSLTWKDSHEHTWCLVWWELDIFSASLVHFL